LVREAERSAFAKACAYLNYSAGAKWLALAAGVGTAVFYVGLLAVLWLFADLIVNRGIIPDYPELPERDRHSFNQFWGGNGSDEEKKRWDDEKASLLRAIGVDDKKAEALAATTPEAEGVTARDRQLMWRAYVPFLLNRQVNAEAAALAQQVPNDQPITDVGILSLVVRTHASGRFVSPLIDRLARWNPWSWHTRSARGVNYVYYLTELFLVALVLALLRAVLAFVMREEAARASVEAAMRLRRAVYHHTFRLGTLAFRALGPSEAVTIFTRHVEAILEALYARLTVSFREPIQFVLLLAFALLVEPLLAVAFLLFAILVWLLGGQVAAYFRRKGRAASDAAAEQLTLVRESLMLMRLVKVYLMELFNQARVERLLGRYARAQLVRLRGEAIFKPVLFTLGTLAALVLLYVAGLIVLDGRLGAAGTVALATALVSLYWPVHSWLGQRRVLRRGRDASVALFKFLERPGEVGQVVGAEFLPPMAQQLEFDNVSLREPGSTRMLLQDVSLAVPAGKRIGIVGPDDLEKHSLVYLIPRLLDPTSGEIRIDQHNLRWVTLDSLRNQIAVVLQNNLVFHDTVANNIGCGDQQYTLPRIIDAAKMAHAHHFIQKLPKGYETAIGELGHSLTSSQQFLIALARAILRDPALVIIEEPEQPMDEDTKSLLDDTLARFLPGRTAIFLPHRISTIRSCDKIYLLRNGRIEAQGEHRELLSGNPLYRHLHYLEFAEVGDQG
jgi:ATP-binding cassette, subfamily B, bacterial